MRRQSFRLAPDSRFAMARPSSVASPSDRLMAAAIRLMAPHRLLSSARSVLLRLRLAEPHSLHLGYPTAAGSASESPARTPD